MRKNGATIVRGVLAGMAIIVGAVLISAVGFGSYGWGLLVFTPILVGVTMAYIATAGRSSPAGGRSVSSSGQQRSEHSP